MGNLLQNKYVQTFLLIAAYDLGKSLGRWGYKAFKSWQKANAAPETASAPAPMSKAA